MRNVRPVTSALILASLAGCGTTRMTNTARTGTEQLLLSQAWDDALRRVDFQDMAGMPVYLETAGIKDVPDQGWIVSSIRQALLQSGALIRSKPEEAQWIVEARVGAFGTDDSSFMIGIPQVTVPQVMPGIPGGTVPEMPLMKKSHQKGTAKLALFAYDRKSGQLVWASGNQQATANAKDLYVGGLGPFQRGSIRRGTEFMDVRLSNTPERPSGAVVVAPAAPAPQSLPTPAAQEPAGSGTP